MASRIENAIDAMQDEFQNITEANGYRNDLLSEQVIRTIRHPGIIQTFPEIGIQHITDQMTPIDSAWNIYDGMAEIRVAGRVKPYKDQTADAVKMNEALDSLKHDMDKVMFVLAKKYKVDSTSPWVIASGGWKCARNTVLSPSTGWGEVVYTFTIRLRNVTSTFE